MPDDIEKINEIFRIHDENAKKKTGQTGKTGAQPAAKPQEQPQEPAAKDAKDRSSRFSAVDNFFIDKNGDENHNYTGDEMTERDYRPVRQSREYRSGCLGGVMYFVFVTALSVVLACFAWMAASDALALNKDNFTAVVTLPNSIFEIATVDDLDENGNKIGTKRVSQADVSYVADALKDAGLIEYKWLFEAFCKISHAGSKVDPGSYELRSSFDYRALIKNMQSGSGSTLTTTVTIPEGFSMHQIFLRLEEEGVCSYNDLMEAAATATFNYSFLEGGEEGSAYRLEGFLFPDTYEFYKGADAKNVINTMLKNFDERFDSKMEAEMQLLGYSKNDIIIMASIIEKETDGGDQRNIASVLQNRLKNTWATPKGYLQVDSTIQYLLKERKKKLTDKDLEIDSPYNTYKNPGLPIGPICNPGLTAIEAALEPNKTNYYYFMLGKDGTTHFFDTEAAFLAFKAEQQD